MNGMRACLAAMVVCPALAAQAVPLAGATVVSTSPAQDAENVLPLDVISVTFDVPMGTPDETNFVVHTSMTGDAVLQGNYAGAGTTTLSFQPAAPFWPNETINVTLTSGLLNANGDPLGVPFCWRFRVRTGAVQTDFSLTPPAQIAAYSSFARNIIAADLDGDATMDIFAHTMDPVTGHKSLANLLQNTAMPLDFSVASTIATATGGNDWKVMGMAAADMNGDGWLDGVVSNFAMGGEAATNWVYFNDGSGGYSDADRSQFGGSDWSMNLVVADFDGEGELDIANVNALQTCYVYLNKGAGLFGNTQAFRRLLDGESGAAQSIDAADFDLDGDLDAVRGMQSGATSNFIFSTNDGAAYFTAGATIGHHYNSVWSVAAGDFDSDGAADLAVCGSAGSSVYFNDGSGAFNENSYADFGTGQDNANVVAAGDIDGDGHLDVFLPACANPHTPSSPATGRCFLNDGQGALSQVVLVPGGKLESGRLADMDGDGDIDAISNDVTAAQLSIFINGGHVALFGSPALPNGEEGVPYLHTLQCYSGTAPYTWSKSDPAAPVWSWLSLSNGGVLSGTPPIAGETHSFDVTIGDADGDIVHVTLSLYVAGPAGPLPWMEDFETANLGPYTAGGGPLASAGFSTLSGSAALRMETSTVNGPWSVTSQSDVEDPANWNNVEPDRGGTLEWAVDGTGVSAAYVEFDYGIVNAASNPAWYANFAFEWSSDSGATWNVATGGTGATAQGVYCGATGALPVHTGMTIAGINAPGGDLRFRFHWLVRWSEAAALATCILIDNIHVSDTTAGPAAPTVSQVSPASGSVSGGETVTLTGANLAGSAVTFDGIAANVLSTSASAVNVAAPAHAAGLVDVTVTTAGGAATLSAAYEYVMTNVPALTNISPASGPLTGGTPVVIGGVNLESATVSFGGIAATVVSNTPVSLEVTAPAGTAPGSVDVTVSTASGSAVLSAAYLYVALAASAPVLASLTPSTGPVSGGTLVVIAGLNLEGASVTIGGAAATVISNTATEIHLLTPAHAAGAADVTVTTSGGTVALALAFTYLETGATPPEPSLAAAGGCAIANDTNRQILLLSILLTLLLAFACRTRAGRANNEKNAL